MDLVVEGGVDRVGPWVEVVLVKEVVVAGVDVRPVADDEELCGRLAVRVVALPVGRREHAPRGARAREPAEAAA